MAAAAGAAADEVYVRERVSAHYVKSPATLENTLTSSMDRPVSINRGDALSTVISQKFGVGMSNSSSAYKAIESNIQERNNIDDPDKIRHTDTLLIPDLPYLAKERPGTANPHNRIPKLDIGCHSGGILCKLLQKTGLSTGVSKDATGLHSYTFESLRKGSQEVWQIRPVARGNALSLVAKAPGRYQIDSAPITVQLAQVSMGPAWAPLNAPESALIKERLAKTPTKQPILIILDDSWPDDKSFQDSKAFFLDAIESIRKKYRMGRPSFSAQLRNAKTTKYTDSRAPSDSKAAAGSHAAKIKSSIAPFLALEPPEGRVRVTYLPLTRVQDYAAEILENIIAINLIVKDLGGRLGDEVPPDLQSTAIARAHAFVARIGTSLGASLKTDQAVVEAVLMCARLLAEFPSKPVFVNMSWTVPNLDLPIYVPEDAYGLYVVAAGNEGDNQGTTVYDLKRQFAYRSRFPGDMLAVMNLSRDGSPVCSSSLLEVRDDVVGLGFDGALSDVDCGGTSFAAPRVAWLVAAREAMKPSVRSLEDWLSGIRAEMKRMRSDNASGFNKMRLDISKLFGAGPNL